MAFTPATFVPLSAQANSDAPRFYVYKTSDAIATVQADDYFLTRYQNLAADDIIYVSSGDSLHTLIVTASAAGGVDTLVETSQELTASGAVNAGVQSVELNHATVAITSTIATALTHPGLFTVVDTSASGSATHTVTLTVGTWDGTNDVVSLNAPKECIVVWFDSAGNGTIVENVGSVSLS